ncbi:hypothetical protein AX15_006381 [Amanita polypyramis BW_CC]|nr:hypothetical protein AX15_006381 [Amanita polypyramis BW_CC]
MTPSIAMNKIDLSRVNSDQERPAKNTANTFPRCSPRPPSAQGPEQKKMARRSNKLIINWLHRKLVGTVKKPDGASHSRQKARGLSRTANRLASSPLPSQTSNNGRMHTRSESSSAAATRRKTLSLNGDDDANDRPHDEEDDISYRPSSLTRDSTWSPASVLEADDDASVRPLPPSVPPSPSPSRSSSSYLSHPHTFKSIAASTKPTTLLSIDLSGNGMAHIAQAPLTVPSHINRFSSQPHARQTSLTSGSITFSALPATGLSRPSSITLNGNPSPSAHLLTVQAPLHTAHHPRNNPRPSSPPLDNASVLTLASSAFGIPGRQGIAGYSSATASALGAGDSVSHFDGSVTYPDVESTSIVIGDDDRLDERDLDASVRALRPRSSRRGSWESEASGWSARIQQVPGTPSLLREKSLWTANSAKTEGFSADNVEVGQDEQSEAEKGDSVEESTANPFKLSQCSSEPESMPGPGGAKDSEHSIPRSDSIDTVAQAER